MMYLHLPSMTWPFFQGDVDLDPQGGYVPLVVSFSEYNPETQKLIPSAPEEVDGVWRVLHTAEDLTSLDKNLQAALLEEKERLAKKLTENEMIVPPELAQDMENLNGSAPDVVG
jgi:hypothetical protein